MSESHSVVSNSFWDPMNCSSPVSSVHGILHVRILEWVAISFSRGSSQPRDQTHVSCIGRRILYRWASREAPLYTWFPLILAFLLGILTVWFISFIACSQTSSFSSIILVNMTSLCWRYTEGCAVMIRLCIFMLYLSSFRAGPLLHPSLYPQSYPVHIT